MCENSIFSHCLCLANSISVLYYKNTIKMSHFNWSKSTTGWKEKKEWGMKKMNTEEERWSVWEASEVFKLRRNANSSTCSCRKIKHTKKYKNPVKLPLLLSQSFSAPLTPPTLHALQQKTAHIKQLSIIAISAYIIIMASGSEEQPCPTASTLH